MLAKRQCPQAFAGSIDFGSDEIAEGAIEAFQEQGLRSPKDSAIVIYEDIKTLNQWENFTRVRCFRTSYGKRLSMYFWNRYKSRGVR